MPALAANPAIFPHLPLWMVAQANRSLPQRNGNGGLRSAIGVLGSPHVAAIAVDIGSQNADENFALACVFRLVSRLLLGHGFGAFHAPVGSSLFCFYGFQKTFVQRAQKDFPNLPQMQSFGTREHGPLAWLCPV